MVGVIFMSLLVIFAVVIAIVMVFGGEEIGPSDKLKKRNRRLERDNEALEDIKQNQQKEIEQLKAENFALRNGLPYPTIEAQEAEDRELMAKIEQYYKEKVNGSKEQSSSF